MRFMPKGRDWKGGPMKNEKQSPAFDPKKLRKLRMAKKLSWLELSRALKEFEPKVSKNSVWAWETGRHEPSVKSLNALSSYFGLPIEDFMKGSH